MEPAGERREHEGVADADGDRLGVAAMEPAGERREHTHRSANIRRAIPPQWSPPVKGGSTARKICGV
jgi:hypothetical protein